MISRLLAGAGAAPFVAGEVLFNFGSAPGTNVVTTVVPDTATTGTSTIDLYIMGTDSTATHNAIEHQYLPLGFVSMQAISRTAGVGFTAQAATPLRLTGVFKARYVIQ